MELFRTAWVVLLDPWVLFGLLAQGIFFGRFIVQWLASERAGVVTIPRDFWSLSATGAKLILIFGFNPQENVFILGLLAALSIYVRNIIIDRRGSVPA